jgi:hypothetical protein
MLLCTCRISLSLIELESSSFNNEFNLTEEQIYLFKRIKSLEHVKNPYANLKANQSIIYVSNEKKILLRLLKIFLLMIKNFKFVLEHPLYLVRATTTIQNGKCCTKTAFTLMATWR